MQDPQQIWEFGRWIARRDPGSVRLTWTSGEVVLGVLNGRIHSADGMDSTELSQRLGCECAGEEELLAEARALGEAGGIPETKAMGTAKKIIQEAFHGWLMDPERRFAIDDHEPAEVAGATISITHALVELVLADTDHNVAETILPDRGVSLQRSSGFIELYAPLRLSEEADLIVAGITGTASVASVANGSEHRPEEVVRLVAALVATGVLDAVEPIIPGGELDWSGADLDDDEVPARKIPVWMIGAAALLLVVVLAVMAWFFGGSDAQAPEAMASGDWGVVVEMGCEPQDLQRMVKKKNQERKNLRTVKADPANGDPCFRLVWGRFATRSAAEEAVDEIPSNLIEEGFEPHVIEVTDGTTDGALEVGD